MTVVGAGRPFPIIMPRLDLGIFFAAAKKDTRVRPGCDEN
jgi:hypothetical protein